MSRISLLCLGVLATAEPALLAAQTLDTLPEAAVEATVPAPPTIRWWHGAVALGGLSTLSLIHI